MSAATPTPTVSTLYLEHHPWLLGWLRRKLGCPHNAADLSQDAFVRLLELPGVPTLREPRAYLATVAKHLLLNHQRRRALEQAYLSALAALPESLAPSPEQQLAIWQSLLRIDTILSGLPANARNAFLLAQVEGLGYADIAQRLGVTERSVKRYMAQAYELCILQAD